MNERERAILLGKNIQPQTADEAVLKYAVGHGGGGSSDAPVVVNLSDFDEEHVTYDEETGITTVDDTVDASFVYEALKKGVPVWTGYGERTGFSSVAFWQVKPALSEDPEALLVFDWEKNEIRLDNFSFTTEEQTINPNEQRPKE